MKECGYFSGKGIYRENKEQKQRAEETSKGRESEGRRVGRDYRAVDLMERYRSDFRPALKEVDGPWAMKEVP